MRKVNCLLQRGIAGLLCVLMVLGMSITGFAAGPNRTATPPEGAPSTAVLVEGESGKYGPDAGTNTDHDYSGSGFASIGGSHEDSNVTYTINVDTAGTYAFAFNYIAGVVSGWNNYRSIKLSVNGEEQAIADFASTGNWDTWLYTQQELKLQAGENTVKVAGNGKNNGICIDYFYYWLVKADDVMPQLIPPTAKQYQAESKEDATYGNGAVFGNNHNGYTGTGFIAGFENGLTAYVDFKVEVPAAGEYYLSLRYANGKNGGWPDTKNVGLSINGAESLQVPFTTTGQWNQWAENLIKVELQEGVNSVKYHVLGEKRVSCVNIDRLSVWAHSDNPVVDTLIFDKTSYSLRAGSTVQPSIHAINTNGVEQPYDSEISFRFEDDEIASYDAETGTIKGLKVGETKVYATGEGISVDAEATLKVLANPIISVDFSSVEREVPDAMFGYILTPNYNVPDSRMTLLGPTIVRDTIPAQNYQGVGDMGGYYDYEGSILQRCLQAYNRVKDTGGQWYFLLGHNPSWATASGNPVDTGKVKTPEQLARFKQYLKDTLQYFKDNGATPDFANLTNEYWTGLEPTYQVAWEALREVYPEFIPAVGPSAVGFDGIPNFYIDYASENGITVEGPAWHEFWTGDTYISYDKLQDHVDYIANLQKQYPEANGKYIIFEENNSGGVNAGGPAGTAIDFTRSMANVIRTGIRLNIKGCLEGGNANGMSDIITANKGKVTQNPAVRRPLWWVYYAFSKMSGEFVTVDVDTTTSEFTGAACKDTDESKVIVANSATDGSVSVVLNNQPYVGQDVQVDLYKVITSDLEGLDYPGENDGLIYQRTIDVESTKDIDVTIEGVKANETWMAVLKKVDSAPSFFHPMTPDDGEAALTTPELTWSVAQGATSYSVTLSENKDLSNPIIKESGIKGTSYQVTTPLDLGKRYYWVVSAENEFGSTELPDKVVYTFYTSESTQVPAQFSYTMPSLGAMNESERIEFKWTSAYQADSYRLVVSENEDLSDPVINKSGITSVRGNGQFGGTSQAYYRPTQAEALDFETTYYWTVFAQNEEGERPINGPLHYFTTKAESDAPKDFTLQTPANGATELSARTELTWEASKNAFFYKLEVSANEDMSDPVIVRDRMIYNKYTVEPNVLLPNTTYYWRVSALTKDLKHETESSSGIRSFTTEDVPCAPLLYAEYEEDGAINLRFQPSAGATSYTIRYGTEPGKYTGKIENVTGSPYQVTGLPNGTYYFAVEANNENGSSSIWNERSVTLTTSDVVPSSTDKSLLKDSIDLANLAKENYPANLIEAVRVKFEAALAHAIEVYNDTTDKYTQEDVDAADDELVRMLQYLSFTADIDGLKAAIDHAKEVIASNQYENDAMMEAYKKALAEAEALLAEGNITDGEIQPAIQALADAEAKLNKIVNKLDLSSLQSEISKSTNTKLLLHLYFDGAEKDAFVAELAAAKALLKTAQETPDEVTQDEIDKQTSDLHAVRAALRLIPNKDALKSLIDSVNAIDRSLYTEASVRDLQAALNAANTVYADKLAGEAAVKNAENKLQDAIDGLVLRTGDGGNDNQGGNANQGDKNDGAQTGDTTNIAMIWSVVLLCVSAGMIGLLRKKKYMKR